MPLGTICNLIHNRYIAVYIFTLREVNKKEKFVVIYGFWYVMRFANAPDNGFRFNLVGLLILR